MNAELLDLKAFVTVAELGSFVRTARALNLSQPALSRRIQKLEESLGAPLLERSTRHVNLTMVGRDFLPKVRRLIDEFETSVLAIHDLGARSSGLVSVAAVPTAVFYFLPRAIGRFAAAYPRIRIRILDIGANEGLEAVARGEADFGINFIGASHADIEFEKLVDDPFVVACRHDHPLASHQRVSWAELASQRVITVGRNSGNRALIDNALARHGLQMGWAYEVAHLSGSLGLVEAGLGIAVLPKLATPASDHPHHPPDRAGGIADDRNSAPARSHALAARQPVAQDAARSVAIPSPASGPAGRGKAPETEALTGPTAPCADSANSIRFEVEG
jgi:DNA-binding transcriptional LysR family regulator